MNSEITDLLASAMATPLDKMANNVKKDQVSPKEVKDIIKKLADSHGIPEDRAFVALALLFLKGAANKGAPPTMGVDIKVDDDKFTSVVKYDVMMACQTVCKHKFLRRIAEYLAADISTFAEKHKLNGDLAIKLNNGLVADGKPPLTTKEKAWANSFCQNLPDLETYTGNRLPLLLAQDFQNRFYDKKKSNKKNPAASEPAPAAPAPPKAGRKTKREAVVDPHTPPARRGRPAKESG